MRLLISCSSSIIFITETLSSDYFLLLWFSETIKLVPISFLY